VSVERAILIQESWADAPQMSLVTGVSDSLLQHLNTRAAIELIAAANVPGNSSAIVQSVFLDFATELGFASEAKGLFDGYENRLLRPDYYMPIGDSGIILEVERGKTTTNNMDLLDLWKCHVCEVAHHLFLMVPQELRHNPGMSPKKEFNAVRKRLGSFFVERNYTNVRSLHIFGY
jgi:hypothetical protein